MLEELLESLDMSSEDTDITQTGVYQNLRDDLLRCCIINVLALELSKMPEETAACYLDALLKAWKEKSEDTCLREIAASKNMATSPLGQMIGQVVPSPNQIKNKYTLAISSLHASTRDAILVLACNLRNLKETKNNED